MRSSPGLPACCPTAGAEPANSAAKAAIARPLLIPQLLGRSLLSIPARDDRTMTTASNLLIALQCLDRLFDAVEEVVAADQGLETLASEALLSAHRFEPREGDV